MTIYNKPAVLPAWAEDKVGVPADMLQPVDADIKTGWPLSAIPPSRQRFNWLLNYAANAIRYFMQRGISVYDATEDYPLHARVQDASGNLYRCIQAGTNHTPATSPTWWKLVPDRDIRGVATGTGDIVAVDFTPDATPLIDGDTLRVQHIAANTGAMTINPDATGALSVYKGGNLPLIAGDVPAADFWGVYVYDASLNKLQMLNPANGVVVPPSVTRVTIFAFAGTSAPAGALLCPTAATTVSRATYADLFAAIGTTWGVGDGATTFGIPWFAANTAMVQANGNVGVVTAGQMPSHSHPYNNSLVVFGGASAMLMAGTGTQGGTTSSVSGNTGSGSDNLAAGTRVLICVQY